MLLSIKVEVVLVQVNELPAVKRSQSDHLLAEEPDELTARDLDKKTVSDQATPPKTAHVMSKASLYKPPTFEELQNLKETEMLFKSNLLKLQVLYNICGSILK